ncbi:pyrimidine 5'-nucleotidase [Sphingomonas japonica]|uniref:Hydrolase of the HAD superfamily n=1 Tax=Sphingomonas japonica TaxID=511662 RepID=A0ABX0U0I2_9SPHN|nr:pyrimidine 5'-nucleotidase [Sphingomonas japonica]NIJ24076.1 putative hydrolase of the HAD superfamily [Sphingomonas japonica]
MLPQLAHIDTWIFDLDNTLYPAGSGLFPQIETRMTDYVCALLGCDRTTGYAAQKAWFLDHGTTLSGLMAERDIDPHEFLAFVHDVDMGAIEANADLAGAIARLPGRKLVFTNGDAPYARRVLDRLGLDETFEGIHDIHATAYRPKPWPEAYRGLCDAWDIDPARALFAEDMARNLPPAKAIGMTTVWVDNGSEQGAVDRDVIDFTTHDIGHWLAGILEDAACTTN